MSAIRRWRPGTAALNPAVAGEPVDRLRDHIMYYEVLDGELSPATQQLLAHAVQTRLGGAPPSLVTLNEPDEETRVRVPVIMKVGFRLWRDHADGTPKMVEVPNLNELGWCEDSKDSVPRTSGPNPSSGKFLGLWLALQLQTADGEHPTAEIETNIITNKSSEEPGGANIWVTANKPPCGDTIAALMKNGYYIPAELEEAARHWHEQEATRYQKRALNHAEKLLASEPHSQRR